MRKPQKLKTVVTVTLLITLLFGTPQLIPQVKADQGNAKVYILHLSGVGAWWVDNPCHVKEGAIEACTPVGKWGNMPRVHPKYGETPPFYDVSYQVIYGWSTYVDVILNKVGVIVLNTHGEILIPNDAWTLQDAGNDFNSATEIYASDSLINYAGYIDAYDENQDWYQFDVESGQQIYVSVTPFHSGADFDVELYNPNNRKKAGPANGISYRLWPSEPAGKWRIKIYIVSGAGPYNFEIKVYTSSTPPGGCPTLFVWNGSEFVEEGALNIHSEPNVDVVVNHELETAPTLISDMYVLKLAEIADDYNYSHSFIDHIQLYAVDENGVRHKCRLAFAIHSRYGNVREKLLFSDDIRVDTIKLDKILLVFRITAPPNTGDTFIFVIEGHNPLKH